MKSSKNISNKENEGKYSRSISASPYGKYATRATSKSTNLSTEYSSRIFQCSESESVLKPREKIQENTSLKQVLIHGIDQELKSTQEKIKTSKENTKGLENSKQSLRKTLKIDQCANDSNFGSNNEEELYYLNNIYSRERASSQPPSFLRSISMRTLGFRKQTFKEKQKQLELNLNQQLLLAKNIGESKQINSLSSENNVSSLLTCEKRRNMPININSPNRYFILIS